MTIGIQYIGFLCPKCGRETANPNAQHLHAPSGEMRFSNIVNALDSKLCEQCEERRVTVHAVLAGAYRGKRKNLEALLTHASDDGGDTALCDGVKAGNLCDLVESGPPTCKACLAMLRSENP
jgi:hypothetical protein